MKEVNKTDTFKKVIGILKLLVINELASIITSNLSFLYYLVWNRLSPYFYFFIAFHIVFAVAQGLLFPST